MPLQRGTSKTVIGNNIAEMEDAGHKPSQAIAAALSTARRSGAKIPRKHAAMGARNLPLQGAPGSGANEHVFAGPLHSHVPGRTDKINLNVQPGSYVVPADVVSSIGEGNTLAGSAVLKVFFGQQGLTGDVKAPEGRPNLMERHLERHEMLPPSIKMPSVSGGTGAGAQGGFADGGAGAGDDPQTQGAIPVVVAGGEHIITPGEIKAKFGDLRHGHESLDELVHETRRREMRRLATAPPPKK